MISAFGVTHEISKSLKPNHIAALQRTKADKSLKNWRKSGYAGDRLNLHSINDVARANGGDPKIARRMVQSRGYFKRQMARGVRTRRGARDKNRKPIFGDSENA